MDVAAQAPLADTPLADKVVLPSGVVTSSLSQHVADYQHAVIPAAQLKGMHRDLAAFYMRQNAAIERALFRRKTGRAWAVDLADSVSDDGEEESPDGVARSYSTAARDKKDRARWHVQSAIYVSFLLNIVIFLFKLIAGILSGSLALISSAIESGLDLLSGSIIFVTAVVQKRSRPHKYPVGRSKLEPVSLVIFSSVMGMAALVLLQEGGTALGNGLANGPPQLTIDAWAFSSLGTSIAVKLGLMLYCWSVAEHSASVGALAADHRNDSLSNLATLVSVIITFYVPSAWYVDPIMAMLLALYILVNWISEGLEQVKGLTGRAASEDQVADLVAITLSHSDEIRFVDTVRAYYAGLRLLVEIDIVLPPDMHLRQAHDVGQSLQLAVERLESVERCFVHLDYTVEHPQDEHIHPDSPKSSGLEGSKRTAHPERGMPRSAAAAVAAAAAAAAAAAVQAGEAAAAAADDGQDGPAALEGGPDAGASDASSPSIAEAALMASAGGTAAAGVAVGLADAAVRNEEEASAPSGDDAASGQEEAAATAEAGAIIGDEAPADDVPAADDAAVAE